MRKGRTDEFMALWSKEGIAKDTFSGWDDFLGNGERYKNESKPLYGDRVVSTAMALNALIGMTYQCGHFHLEAHREYVDRHLDGV